MKRTATKLVLAFLTMVLSVVGLRFLGYEFFFLLFIFGFIFSLLYSMDLGQSLRDSDGSSLWRRTIGVALGIPQAVLGLSCVIVGGAIIAWVLYNTFIERNSEYTGGFLTFGFGPALVTFGAGWLYYAFRRSPPPNVDRD